LDASTNASPLSFLRSDFHLYVTLLSPCPPVTPRFNHKNDTFAVCSVFTGLVSSICDKVLFRTHVADRNKKDQSRIHIMPLLSRIYVYFLLMKCIKSCPVDEGFFFRVSLNVVNTQRLMHCFRERKTGERILYRYCVCAYTDRRVVRHLGSRKY
jgi:hypothetical protein